MLMQYFAFAVVIIISICAITNYKHTVIVWMVVQTLLNAQIAVRYTSPAMSCVLAVDAVLFGIYILKFAFSGNRRVILSDEKYLFKTPLIVMLLSYILSSIVTTVGISAGITATIKYFISNFLLLFLFQRCLKDNNDVKLFVKAAIIVVIIQVSLALSEAIFKDNLWLDFVYFNSPQDDSTYGRMFYVPPQIGGSIEMRYGMVRCRSFFGIHIMFGFFCLMYLHLFLTIYARKMSFSSKRIALFCVMLLFAGVMMGNSKTSYVGLIILLLTIYKPQQLFNFKIVGPILILIIGVLLFFPEYLNNIYSLFDSSIAEEGGGSTISGRSLQFQAAKRMFMMNPLLGNGPGSIPILKEKGFGDILGAESSWMQILPERGLFGAFMYVIMYLSIYTTFKRYLGKKITFFFLFAVFVMETATGILDMTIWATVLVVIKRMKELSSIHHTASNKQLSTQNN